MTGEEMLAAALAAWTDFEVVAPPERLSGGLINFVWRLRGHWQGEGETTSVIAKLAPPHLASNPAVPLDASRLGFEAEALELLGGRLASRLGPGLRVPRRLHFSPEHSFLVMEDLGPLQDLEAVLRTDPPPSSLAPDLGCQWGRTVAQLHAVTWGDQALARAFDNAPVQAVREQVQYRSIGPLLEAAGLPDAADLGAVAADLGQRLREPGSCLLHGDLWPRSLVHGVSGWSWIDWEFCHFGVPAQDLGHLAAHLWMLAHQAARGSPQELAARSLLEDFQSSYLDTLPEACHSPELLRDSQIHMGCEVLVRCRGAFRESGGYAQLASHRPQLAEATELAASWIRGQA